MAQKVTSREKRKARIRRKVSGTAARPRLTVYKSLKHMYAQLVDDVAGKTLVSVASTSKALKAELKGREINFVLGFSHPVVFKLPEGITAEVDPKQTRIVIRGVDKHLLGLTAAKIRALRPPEPYKGKGIKYAEEIVRRKEGKTGAA